MSNKTVIWSCTTAWQKHMLLLPQTCDSQIYSSLSLWVTQRSFNALQLIHQVTRLQISCMLIHDLAVPHQSDHWWLLLNTDVTLQPLYHRHAIIHQIWVKFLRFVWVALFGWWVDLLHSSAGSVFGYFPIDFLFLRKTFQSLSECVQSVCPWSLNHTAWKVQSGSSVPVVSLMIGLCKVEGHIVLNVLEVCVTEVLLIPNKVQYILVCWCANLICLWFSHSKNI